MNMPLSPSASCDDECEWYQCVPAGHALNVYVIERPGCTPPCVTPIAPSKYGVPIWCTPWWCSVTVSE